MPTLIRSRPTRALLAALLAGALLALGASPAGAQSPLAQGPGGPILTVVNPADPFGDYYSEILRAEGLNEFAAVNASSLSAQTLAGHDVVVLASMTLSTAQVQTLSDWVNGGGRLIAMRPDPKLAPLLGLSPTGGSLTDAYLRIDTSTASGTGITGSTMQFHDRADRYSLAGASAVATLYSDALTATANPAVSLRQGIGANGGQAVAFTYDLARSVVGTRQGNVAWAGQKRDEAIDPIRSDDLFFPDWLDRDKIAIPQADEQQRLLANLITQMSLDRTPLPRFWYLPRGEQAAVVMTGDDHAQGQGGTVGQFQWFESKDPAGCSVADWQCVRSTSYAAPDADITRAQATTYQSAGFEIALHLNTGCENYTEAQLDDAWKSQLAAFATAWPGLNTPKTNRTHCITWGDWAGEAKAEAANGVRLDTNYYYWPDTWVQNRPGMFTGSGFPMRFAGEDGGLIDVYQATTQLTDESGIDIATHIEALLDGALGPDGYYGVFTANMHTDDPDHPGAQAIVNEAQRRRVPVVSAAQMLNWLDGRNGSSFGDLSFAGGQLRFSVHTGNGSRGLQGMLPTSAGGRALVSLRRGDQPVSLTSRTVKGIAYAMFDAGAGDYVAQYGTDQQPPETTVGAVTVTGSVATVTFGSDDLSAHFQCQVDGGAFDACSSPATFPGLATGAHTVGVRAIDPAGNADPTPAERTFPVGDRTPPQVVAIAPADGASGVDRGAVVTATFDEDIDPSSLTAATFQLRDGSGTLVPADITYFAATRTATLRPRSPLTGSTSYSALIKGDTGGVRDPSANPLAHDHAWSFTIAPSDGGPSREPGSSGSPGANPGTGTPGAPTTHGPSVKVTPKAARASRTGTVSLRVSCPPEAGRCRVTLRLTLRGKLAARRTLIITGGRSSVARLKLSRAARRLLARHRSLPAVVTAVALDQAGEQSTTRTSIRLRAPRK